MKKNVLVRILVSVALVCLISLYLLHVISLWVYLPLTAAVLLGYWTFGLKKRS